MVDSTPRELVYGPVPSRRLGRSLGVDLVPLKVCPFDCIYCQLGRTTHKTLDRAEYVPAEQVVCQVREKLAAGVRPDHITLAGSGEPTLHIRLGWIIEQIKQCTDVPVAVLTNGALLRDPEVRRDCARADVVMPSLDAGDEQRFVYVNRPHRDLTLEQVVDGLVQFRREYAGQIWLEVFLLAGVTAIDAEVRKIAALVRQIEPDRIMLNTAVRPTAEVYAEAASPERLERLCELFSPKAEVVADFASPADRRVGPARSHEVLAMLRRRPCRIADVANGLSIDPNEAVKCLSALVEEGLVRERFGREGHYFEAVQE